MKTEIPFHLRKFIVEQEPQKYTPLDQAVWRFVLRQLKTYLSKNAHESYLDGLKQTGITIEEIPSIENISQHLSKFGWKAAPVSGFIPPASFLELQALKILPIASDMRSLDTLTYTPAPDIVHEAAGHAPMLANAQFRKYLEEYALVARKAIINNKDLELYDAIRDLSDIKEHPNATKEQIAEAQERLDKISASMGEPSEASILSRMAWWTTEYGLIGDGPHIYGAGLLSSAGEAKSGLSSETKKIPFSLECINFNYDITEPQPQLFVTDSFETLSKVLDELAETMAFRKGGMYGLQKALEAKTATTIEFETGVQISGQLTNIIGEIVYLQFTGPCQISYQEKELKNQGRSRHPEGFGCPVGRISSQNDRHIIWESGVELTGTLIGSVPQGSKVLVKTFKDCKVTYEGKTLFDPSWGEFDLILGEKVCSVFGGAADKEAYGDFDDFVVKKVPPRTYSEEQKNLFNLYQEVRNLRKNLPSQKNIESNLFEILKTLNQRFPKDWLLKLEILELTHQLPQKPSWSVDIENDLKARASEDKKVGSFLLEGLKLSTNLSI